MKRITDTIPLYILELAILNGWNVYAYSEYTNGIPRFAEVEKWINN